VKNSTRAFARKLSLDDDRFHTGGRSMGHVDVSPVLFFNDKTSYKQEPEIGWWCSIIPENYHRTHSSPFCSPNCETVGPGHVI